MASNSLSRNTITVTRLRTCLEDLQIHITDLEALAHAAAQTLEKLPYVPRLPRSPWTDEQRISLGRTQALVSATAESAARLLREVASIMEGFDVLDDPGSDGSAAPDSHGGPGGSTSGGHCNAKAIGRAASRDGCARASATVTPAISPRGMAGKPA